MSPAYNCDAGSFPASMGIAMAKLFFNPEYGSVIVREDSDLEAPPI
jgi:hypothetical protein